MKHTFEPRGDYIIPDGSNRKVNSLVHHLGLLLESYLNENARLNSLVERKLLLAEKEYLK